MGTGKVKPWNDWRSDGWPHKRDENGTCENCGASANEYHYRLLPREEEGTK